MYTRSIVRNAIALTALACLSATNAHAQIIYYPNDATINYTVDGYVVVGYANQSDFNNRTNGTSPTVNLTPAAASTT